MNLSNHVASVKKTGNQSLTQVKKAKSGTKPLFLTRNTVKKNINSSHFNELNNLFLTWH